MKLSATVKKASPMPKSKYRTKKAPPRVLTLPDLEHAKTAVLNSLTSASGQRTYEQGEVRGENVAARRSTPAPGPPP